VLTLDSDTLIIHLWYTCAGLLRLERWQRAKEFGFNPPSKVRDLVIAHSDDDRYTQWYEAFI